LLRPAGLRAKASNGPHRPWRIPRMNPAEITALPKICFAATVVNLLDAGDPACGRPWRAVIQDANGTPYYLPSHEPIRARAMGDIIGVAHRRESGVAGLPDELIIPAGTDVQHRLREQIDLTDPNASFAVQSLGAAMKDKHGPGLVAWLATGGWFGKNA